MAKLPDLTTQERPLPQPSGGIVGYRAGIGEHAAMEANDELFVQMRRDQDRLDTLAAEAALTKLRQKQLDMTYGKDEGFTNVRGEDAIKPDFHQTRIKKFDSEVGMAAQGLSQEALTKFKSRAVIARMQFNEGLLRHSAHEGDVYADQTYKGIVKVESEIARKSWIDPNAVATSVVRVKKANDDMAERFGWSADVRKANEATALKAIHAGVVEEATAAGAYKYARDYAKANELGDAVIKAIDKDEEEATFDTKSIEGADALLALTGGDYARAKQEATKIPDGKLAKAVRQEIETREIDDLHAENEANKQSLGTGHLLIEQGVSRAALKNSPAYKSLDDGGKAALLSAHDARMREKRAEASAAGEQTTQAQWEHYADLMQLARDNQDAFREMHIKSELWKVPKALRDNLMSKWGEKPEDAKESSVTLEQQIKAATTGMDKAERGKFEGAMVQERMVREKAKGAKLTVEENQKLIDQMLIERDAPWYKGGDKPTYKMTPEERAQYAPIIPKDDRKAIIEKFKQRGKETPSDEEIMGIYKKWKGIP